MNHAPRVRARCSRAFSLTVALSCVALALAACSQSAPQKKDTAGELKKREKARVRVAAVAEREMVRTLETTTTVESDKEVKLYPRTTGTVIAVEVEEGDAVVAGATLLEIDARSLQAMVDEAHVTLKESKNNATRSAILESEAEARIAHTQLAWDQGVRSRRRERA